MIVNIDGVSGSGKTTIATQLAAWHNGLALFSGLYYRYLTWTVLQEGLIDQGPFQWEHYFRDWQWDLSLINQLQQQQWAKRLYESKVNASVGQVAQQGFIRDKVNSLLRQQALTNAFVVAEGRDMSSCVFIDAPIQFFLYADVALRAQRVSEQRGISVDEAQNDLQRRDQHDFPRAFEHPHESVEQRFSSYGHDKTLFIEVKGDLSLILEKMNKIILDYQAKE